MEKKGHDLNLITKFNSQLSKAQGVSTCNL